MTYEEELRARLDAVRTVPVRDKNIAVNTTTQQQKVFDELTAELEFARYDLDESDTLRTLKVLDSLELYNEVFRYKSALKLFYIITRLEVVTPKKLLVFSKLSIADFKAILNSMAKCRLLFKNESGEIELTMDGKSLASRIGLDIFL